MKMNEFLKSAEIYDQVSLEDCKVRKINQVKSPEENQETDSNPGKISVHKDYFSKAVLEMSRQTN